MEKINFRQRRDFSQKISATFEFISQNFKSLLKCLLFIVGPIALIAGILFAYYMQFYFRIIGDSVNGAQDPDALASDMLGEMIFLAIGMGITASITFIMVITVVYDYIKIYLSQDEAQPIEPGQVLKLLKRDVFRITIGLLVVGLIIWISSFFMALIPILGIIIFIPLVIYLSVAMSKVFIIMIYEKVNVFNAISRSFNLISGKWWSTFGLLIVCYLIQWVISFVFVLPTYAVHVVTLYHTLQDGLASFQLSTWESVLSLVLTSISIIGANLLYAIPLIAIAFQYFNLVEMKEGAGLMQEIEQMGKENLVDDQDKY